MPRASPNRGKLRGGWPASTLAPWARWATVRWQSPAATATPGPPGQWGCACICLRLGPRSRSGAAKQTYRLRWASRPNQRLPWLCWIRRGVGEYPTIVWSPMPTMATIPTFLAGLEERGEPYVVGVRADFRISLATQAPRRRADQVLAALPRSLWGTI